MDWKRALIRSAFRFIVLMGVILGVGGVAGFLRPHLYPDGLSGNSVLIIVMVLMCISGITMVAWVARPVQDAWELYEEGQRQKNVS